MAASEYVVELVGNSVSMLGNGVPALAMLAVARLTVTRASHKISRTGPTRGGARPGTERGVSAGQGHRHRWWRPARWYRGSAWVKLPMAVEPSRTDKFLQRMVDIQRALQLLCTRCIIFYSSPHILQHHFCSSRPRNFYFIARDVSKAPSR
jgi:hypothetical protein